MNFQNPTALRIGMTGTIAGKDYRIAGRVVMGMEEGGETYYWNEFNLVTIAGDTATLVYEITERGGEWRLFTLFEPDYPMTAADAATRQVGDALNLDGTPVRVTLVDESRVYDIEGEAPEGVEVGDVAHYFNAQAGDKMQVVSWTGEEVECYHGIDLNRSTVTRAFGLREDVPVPSAGSAAAAAIASAWSDSDTDDDDSGSQFATKAVFLLLIAAVAWAVISVGFPRRTVTVKKIPAVASPIRLGSTGNLGGRKYRIISHALVEIAEVGMRYDRHEYQVQDEDGNEALLICGMQPGAKDWILFVPDELRPSLTPQQAAAKKLGDLVSANALLGPINQLFQSSIQQCESATPSISNPKPGEVLFGFVARAEATSLLARWNARAITLFRGETLPAKDVTAAFVHSTN